PLLEKYKAPVFLRPRRFGKSLLVSTLAYYYDINEADRFEALFGGTYIGSHPTVGHNQYMVLRFDFSTLAMADDMEGLAASFNDMACPVIEDFIYKYRRLFMDFKFRNTQVASKMLSEITSRILSRELPPLYILIDEYDNFTNQLLTAYKDSLYEEVTTKDSFLRTFFKAIKSGLGQGTVRTCFCTGVLPVTMDDLTSGYNVAEILTLKPEFIEMLGFNHEEASTYLRYVIDKYGEDQGSFEELWSLILNNYDGYRFLPNAQPLFNSTILSYFLKNYAELHGDIPDELIDENLRTDIGWIRRLTLTLENAKEMLDKLMVDDELGYSASDLRSKFNKQKFFDKEFYPVSLYYLGMTTFKDKYTMTLPNLTMRSIYMGYYNELNQVTDNYRHYNPVFHTFEKDGVFAPLVESYFKEYLGQFPAQVFDKMNENFIRCSFFDLCYRYLGGSYTFAVEQNLPSGRADFVMIGNPGTPYHNDCRVVEFKYFKAGESAMVEGLETARDEDVTQVKGYADDLKRQFPAYNLRTYVAYIAAGKAYKVWEV
ncbi:MAG: ATP-binding protein, partial [Mediterranea sp.]|nr:ATP-binding protein [Mediterranea sp.]